MNDISAAASALGKLGRAKNTQAQQEASRENGKRGGRPKSEGRQYLELVGAVFKHGQWRLPIFGKPPYGLLPSEQALNRLGGRPMGSTISKAVEFLRTWETD